MAVRKHAYHLGCRPAISPWQPHDKRGGLTCTSSALTSTGKQRHAHKHAQMIYTPSIDKYHECKYFISERLLKFKGNVRMNADLDVNLLFKKSKYEKN